MNSLLATIDVNDMRVVLAVINFAIFIGILYWVYGRTSVQKTKDFEDAALVPFRNDEDAQNTLEKVKL